MSKPVQPFRPVVFENGVECTLLDDGSVRVTVVGRGQRALSIEPASHNSVVVRPDKQPLILSKP